MNTYLSLDSKIKFICNHNYKFFLNKKNVCGIALGYKTRNGFNTCKKCITVFVSKKFSQKFLTSNDMIPKYFKGILTDVVESGFFTECSLRNRIRPVIGGYSIGANEVNISGTTGCLVTNGVLKFLLSSNHMIANLNSLPLGTPILQPGYLYGGRNPNDAIGTLYKYIPLRFIEGERQPVNLSDSAIAELNPPDVLSPEIALIGKPLCVKNPKLNEHVKKVGSSTELTEGTVLNTSATFVITYLGGSQCLFKDAILTSSMSLQGDSGAILVNKNMCALGLLFSMSAARSAYCRLSTVLDQLGVHLVI